MNTTGQYWELALIQLYTSLISFVALAAEQLCTLAEWELTTPPPPPIIMLQVYSWPAYDRMTAPVGFAEIVFNIQLVMHFAKQR